MPAVSLATGVWEVTTTTGTGSYSLGGAKNASQFTFASAYSTGALVPVEVTDGTGREWGIYTYTAGSPGTLARTTILGSTNGGAAVNWGAGAKDIFVTNLAELQPFAPMASDPASLPDGRSWFNTTISAFRSAISGVVYDIYTSAQVNLAALAGLSGASDKIAYFTGAGAMALASFTSFGRSLASAADAPTARGTLGLGTSTVIKNIGVVNYDSQIQIHQVSLAAGSFNVFDILLDFNLESAATSSSAVDHILFFKINSGNLDLTKASGAGTYGWGHSSSYKGNVSLTNAVSAGNTLTGFYFQSPGTLSTANHGMMAAKLYVYSPAADTLKIKLNNSAGNASINRYNLAVINQISY